MGSISWLIAFVVVLLDPTIPFNTSAGFSSVAWASDEKPAEVLVHLRPNTSDGTFEVIGVLPEILTKAADLSQQRWQKLFPVFTGEVVDKTKPSILGTYQINGQRIGFQPRFPLIKGTTYTAQFNLGLLAKWTGITTPISRPVLSETFTLPKPPIVAITTVSHIFPSANQLPENFLKFYIHFSAPMQRGQIYQYIYLQDGEGNRVDRPFLELEPELWDPGARRVTIFFHPGRIKRGLRPHEELGLALQVGNRYQLVIDQNMQDENGNPLVETVRKNFHVIESDRTSPNYKNWNLTAPTSGTYAPVILTFSESLDRALLGRMLDIQDANGNSIGGSVHISLAETQWRFEPQKPWHPGAYTIQVNTILEDLAGNQLHRLFDVDLQNKPQTQAEEKKYITLPLKISPKQSGL